jgi:hypothetical protein
MTCGLRDLARLLVSIGLTAAMPRAAAAQSGTIAGRVTIKGSDIAVGYAVLAVRAPARELFAGADGAFTLRGLPAGTVTVTVKHIGYSPFDTTLTVSAGTTRRLDVGLSLLTVQLPTIHSLAQRCSHPGDTSAALSLELAALFEQVKQNAERQRLLARSYPFELTVERKISRAEPLLEARFVAYDTVRISSLRKWRYAPGKLLGTREYGPGVFAGKWVTITMPELADFADEAFLGNHCFDYGGMDEIDGDSLLRVEFIPAPRVHDPDVAGTLFLDPHTYQLRLTLMSVVNLNAQMRKSSDGQSVRASFVEIVPGVSVPQEIASLVFVKSDPKGPPREPSAEVQRTLSVKFLKGRP